MTDEDEIVKGGQGRRADQIEYSCRVCAYAFLLFAAVAFSVYTRSGIVAVWDLLAGQ